MNWKLTQQAINGAPQLEDWSVWKVHEDRKQPFILDLIYDVLEAEGMADEVVKIRPGVYLGYGGGWLF